MKTRLLVFVSVAVWVMALGWISAAPDDHGNGNSDEVAASDAARIKQGFDIAPVQLSFEHKDRALVGLAGAIGALSVGCFASSALPRTYGQDESGTDGKKIVEILRRSDPDLFAPIRHVLGLLHWTVRLRDIPQWMYDAARSDTYQPAPNLHDSWVLGCALDQEHLDSHRCRELLAEM